MNEPLAALSVDLDEVDCYRRIHGLPSRERGRGAVYEVALERIAAFASAHKLSLSLFAVAADLERRSAAARLAELARGGHEAENHSLAHRYDLSRLPAGRIHDEVARAHERIGQVAGRAPVGFRAPGYTISDPLLEVLEELRYRFDSSVFPCPPYYVAKACVLAGQRLRGRKSAAVLDTPRVLLAPSAPYRPSRPWYRPGGRGLLELPIQVTPRLRLPVIGTSLVLAGEHFAPLLVRRCVGAGFVNLELHGVDFLGADDGLEDLLPVQPDLRVPWVRKRAVWDAVVGALRSAGCRFVTLATAAAEISAGRGPR